MKNFKINLKNLKRKRKMKIKIKKNILKE